MGYSSLELATRAENIIKLWHSNVLGSFASRYSNCVARPFPSDILRENITLGERLFCKWDAFENTMDDSSRCRERNNKRKNRPMPREMLSLSSRYNAGELDLRD